MDFPSAGLAMRWPGHSRLGCPWAGMAIFLFNDGMGWALAGLAKDSCWAGLAMDRKGLGAAWSGLTFFEPCPSGYGWQ